MKEKMNDEEIIQTLREFEKNRVENLNENAKNLFYAIMKIADERDKYKKIVDDIQEIIEKDWYKKNTINLYDISASGDIRIKIIKVIESQQDY